MLKLIAILFDRMVIHEYTSEVTLSILQNRGSLMTNLIISIISLLIWFSCGLILAYWVKKDLKKRNLESNTLFILILLTSFIGFIMYIIVIHSQVAILEDGKSFPEIDEVIKEEEEAEFHDEIEEICEEEVEDIIEIILKHAKIETD
ncbi:MAG: hypothetical protein ACFE91_06910 [Promethearchaeota archaeon]